MHIIIRYLWHHQSRVSAKGLFHYDVLVEIVLQMILPFAGEHLFWIHYFSDVFSFSFAFSTCIVSSGIFYAADICCCRSIADKTINNKLSVNAFPGITSLFKALSFLDKVFQKNFSIWRFITSMESCNTLDAPQQVICSS